MQTHILPSYDHEGNSYASTIKSNPSAYDYRIEKKSSLFMKMVSLLKKFAGNENTPFVKIVSVAMYRLNQTESAVLL
jgi:hypothetical protein